MSDQQLQRAAPFIGVLGLSAGSFLTGYIASFSITTVPALQASGSVPVTALAVQWQKAYKLGKATAPPFAVATAACFGILAYHTRHMKSSLPVAPAALYAAAALLTPSIVPITIFLMGPTIHSIEARAEGRADAPSEAETKALITKWSGQNLYRAAIVGSAVVLGAVATLA